MQQCRNPYMLVQETPFSNGPDRVCLSNARKLLLADLSNRNVWCSMGRFLPDDGSVKGNDARYTLKHLVPTGTKHVAVLLAGHVPHASLIAGETTNSLYSGDDRRIPGYRSSFAVLGPFAVLTFYTRTCSTSSASTSQK